MKRLLFATAATATLLTTLVGPVAVSANDDPHRTFLPAAPFDLPAGTYCAFDVHLDILADREYAATTILPDGSTRLTVTGSYMLAASNDQTGKTIVVNAGGPGTFTALPNGTTVIGSFRGRALFFAPNLTQFGFPSNVVLTAGPEVVTQEYAGDGSFTFTSFEGHPQLITDVCAALS